MHGGAAKAQEMPNQYMESIMSRYLFSMILLFTFMVGVTSSSSMSSASGRILKYLT